MTAKGSVRISAELFLLFESHGALLQWMRLGPDADAFAVRLSLKERRSLAAALASASLPWTHPKGGFELDAAAPDPAVGPAEAAAAAAADGQLRLRFYGPRASYQGGEGTLTLDATLAERLRAALAGELAEF
ncbi:MAG: hypothetical protein CSA62_15475 [Planctomycetota bacterium]|nr:MAG: hypothetical protein CSA62_15475 [Planctomycetota bacterium]